MPRPYSIDSRKKVLEAVDKKNCLSKKSVKINPKTIYLWRKRREETGSIEAITRYQKGHSHKIKNTDVLIDLCKIIRMLRLTK